MQGGGGKGTFLLEDVGAAGRPHQEWKQKRISPNDMWKRVGFLNHLNRCRGSWLKSEKLRPV